MSTTHEKSSHCIDVCNRLLRGELSAVETYNRAIEKFSAEPEVVVLTRIRYEHVISDTTLQENVRKMGGNHEIDSGAWGSLAKTMQAAANFFGENSAVCSLRTGEKTGREDYEKALEDQDVMPACKDLIRAELLPRVDEHIAALERLGKAI